MSAMLDTPMADYGSDIDVFMQPHSDPWIQDDGTMDDDSFSSYNQTDSIRSLASVPADSGLTMSLSFSGIITEKDSLSLGQEPGAVEVEMEEYMEEPQEYDMQEDDENPIDDIQDVEVHDLPIAPAAVGPSPQISFSLSNDSNAPIPEISSLVNPDASYDLSHDSPQLNLDSSKSHESLFVTQDHSVPSDNIDTPTPVEADSVSHLVEGTTDITGEADHDAPGPEPHDGHIGSEVPEQPARTAEGETAQFGPFEHAGVETEHVAPESVATNLSAGHEDLQVGTASVEEPESAALDPDTTGLLPNEHDEGTTPGNPHEISDGVYIEPPPAVLIETPTGGTFSLFNRPSTSGHSTPSPEDANVYEDVHVLLQDRPTLFYEPIFAVFEALRQEEPFYNSPDFRDVELIFEIPSIKLLISEDNVYAREVSLHDFSILHDSFGDGPLRLKLRAQGPRFLLRYSELQEHLHRIALADDHQPAGESTEEDASHDHGDDIHANEKGEDNIHEYPEQQNDESSEHEPLQQDQDGQPAPDVADHQPEDSDPTPNSTASDSHQGDAGPTEDSREIGDHDQPESDNVGIQDSEHVEPLEEAQEPEVVVDDVEAATHVDHVSSLEVVNEAGDFDPSGDQQHLLEREADEDSEGTNEPVEEDYYEEEDSETTTETPGDADDLVDPEQVEEDADVAETNLDEVPLPDGEEASSLASPLYEPSDHTDIDHSSELVDTEATTLGDGLLEHPAQDSRVAQTNEAQDFTDEYTDSNDGANIDQNPVEETYDFTGLPELPDDDEFWDDEQDGEGELDVTWDGEQDETISNESSVTMSSKGSKRSHSELDDEDGDDNDGHGYIPSPDKRTRLE